MCDAHYCCMGCCLGGCPRPQPAPALPPPPSHKTPPPACGCGCAQGPEDYARTFLRYTSGTAPVERVAEYLRRLGGGMGSGLHEALPGCEQLGYIFGEWPPAIQQRMRLGVAGGRGWAHHAMPAGQAKRP